MGKQEALKRFTTDLTEQARGGKMDPIVGRDDEIRQVVDILMRRRQNNPILVGELVWARPRWWKVLPSASCAVMCRPR